MSTDAGDQHSSNDTSVGWARQLMERLTGAEQHRAELVEGLDPDSDSTIVPEDSHDQPRALTPPDYDTAEHGVHGLRTRPARHDTDRPTT
ncbi:hypothetical protein [Pseudonocardia endophytica]|uniref:Uncharacterized protein n=1 Tax=Pseudonocardia endophytica TaxID=401976 RepID=A0A4R1HTD2_PSEEN|nr:hypothetical protein [Pseudonocardia endophytica]TCK24631.1 hypothetical protein EV378_0407 [Pseudonocardia endophytica]